MGRASAGDDFRCSGEIRLCFPSLLRSQGYMGLFIGQLLPSARGAGLESSFAEASLLGSPGSPCFKDQRRPGLALLSQQMCPCAGPCVCRAGPCVCPAWSAASAHQNPKRAPFWVGRRWCCDWSGGGLKSSTTVGARLCCGQKEKPSRV